VLRAGEMLPFAHDPHDVPPKERAAVPA